MDNPNKRSYSNTIRASHSLRMLIDLEDYCAQLVFQRLEPHVIKLNFIKYKR